VYIFVLQRFEVRQYFTGRWRPLLVWWLWDVQGRNKWLGHHHNLLWHSRLLCHWGSYYLSL